MVSAGMPGPLSAMTDAVAVHRDVNVGRHAGLFAGVQGVVRQFLQDDNGHSSGSWPVCAVSSFSLQKSSNREVSNVVRQGLLQCRNVSFLVTSLRFPRQRCDE